MTINTGWTPEPTQRDRINNLIAQLTAPDVQFCGMTAKDDDEFEANLTAALRQKTNEQAEYLNHLATTIDSTDIYDHWDAILRNS